MPNHLSSKILRRIEDKKALLDKNRPLPKAALSKLREMTTVEMTYHSNAIEGNTLTLKETRLVLEEGITVSGKPMKDHLEAINHRNALDFLETLIKRKAVEEADILRLHAIISKDIEREFAGRYRQGQVRVAGASFTPPNYVKVPGLIKKLILWINENENKIHTIELASLAHHRFVIIHPFFDGNGRTARLLMNLILIRRGYPPTIVPVTERRRYFNALEKADAGDPAPFANLTAHFVELSLDRYLAAIGQAGAEQIPLSELAPKTRYGAEYLGLLARRGLLEAEKRGKTWFSTAGAVKEYERKRERKR